MADLLKCSSPFITKWKDWCFYTAHCLTSIKGRNELCILLRDRPFNLQGGAMGFFRTTRVRIFFSSEFNIRLYDKNSESDYFFFLHQNQNIFSATVGIRILLFPSFINARLLCFVSHSNDMTSCQSSSAENVSCNVAPFFYHHSVVIQHLVSDTLYQTGDFL